MSIGEEVKSYYTGTKKPTKSRLYIRIGLIIFGFFVSGLAGFYLNSYLQELHKQPNIYANLGPLNKDGIGYYLPIDIINSGQKDLSNIKVLFQNCYTNVRKEEYRYGLMIPGQREQFEFRDTETMDILTRKPCTPDYNFSRNDCEVQVYKLDNETLYVPPMNCSIYLCDFCNYSIEIQADQLSKSKVFQNAFFASKEIKLKVVPEKTLNLSIDKLEKYDGPISLNFFNSKELCIWDKNCTVYDLPTNEIRFKLPIFFTINPKPFKPYNFSIDYLD